MDPTQSSGSPLARSERAKEFLNQRIAHYVILERLGEGGMGIVFKAKDTRLDRLVALKILRPESVADQVRKLRFVQEARAASALNHPNITHIYDIGSESGTEFIAMEYVQGVPLDHLLKEKRLQWREVIEYGVQIADALDAAHAAGILHRDLKPANVIVTDRKTAKVLDFGLAKLMEPDENRNPDLEITRTAFGPETVHGMTVGTPRYMSPEQAAGRKLDARSDIFSFGVLLYQMITRAFPFDGESTAAIFASILRDDPQPPGLMFPDVPLELERIVMRCLRKDPARRFQNMLDAKLALQDIKEEPGTITLRTGAVPVAEPPRRKPWAWIAGGAVAIVALAAGAFWVNSNNRPASESEVVQLTSDSGISTDPAISPDGKLLAYSSDRGGDGNLSIWVQQVGGGEPIRLTNHKANDYEPAFSPQGTRIVFRSDLEGGGIYVVSTLGGEQRRIADGGRSPRFSPDGKWIAYWSGQDRVPLTRSGAAKAYIIDSAGGTPRVFRPDFSTAATPVWSPDGKNLLFRGMKNAGDKASFGWWVAPVEGGSAVQVNDAKPRWIPYAWQGDRVLLSEEAEAEGLGAKLLEIPISSRTWQFAGAAHRLTSGITREDFPSLSADGHVAFASVNYNVDVYAIALNANQGKTAGNLQRLTQDVANDVMPSMSADGNRLAFASKRLGTTGIWTKDLQTGKEAPLVRPTESFPFIRPDGSQVAWNDDYKTRAILAMPFGGGTVRQLCEDCKYMCGWSADGTKILFTDYSSHAHAGVMDVASGVKTIVKHPTASVFPRSLSPDNKWIAVSVENPVRLAIVPADPAQAANAAAWIPITDGVNRDGNPSWSPDGNLLYFTSDRDGLMCIWAQPLDPATKRPQGNPFTVLHLHGALLRMRPNLAMMSIGPSKLAFSLEEQTGNIWMLKRL